jgi:hypothetical protein
MLRIAYIVFGAGSLGLLALEAPAGSLLSTTPDRGKIEAAKADGSGATPRRRYVFIGGGFHGGK